MMEKMMYDEIVETIKRAELFKKIDALDNVIHVLEATANTYYSPLNKKAVVGWNTLLKARDKLKPFIEKEKQLLYDEIKKIDKEREKK